MNYGANIGRWCVRSLGRVILRQFNILRFLAGQSGDVTLGANVLIRNPQFVTCGRGVTIGDSAELIAEPVGQADSSIYLGDSVKIGKRCQLAATPGNIEIGDFASVHTGTYLLGSVYVGRYTLLSANIFASSGDHHPFDAPHLLIREQDMAAQQRPDAVVIEEDCWIGWGAIIKKGIHIGRGAIVGANAVVTSDVAPYTVVVGQPARQIRERLHFVPPGAIQAALPGHGPYLYRGFMQSQSEKDILGTHKDKYVGVLPEAALVLADGGNMPALRLVGRTLAGNASLCISCGDSSRRVELPNISSTPFDITIELNGIDMPSPASRKPAPRLSGCRVISIHSFQRGADPDRQKPLWALSSTTLVS